MTPPTHPLAKPDRRTDRDTTRCGLCRFPYMGHGAEWAECQGKGCESFMVMLDGELVWHHPLECEEIPGVCGLCYQRQYGLHEGNRRGSKRTDEGDDDEPKASPLDRWL